MAVTLLAYQPVWHAGFIWDDDAHLTQNPCIVGPLGFKEIWTTSAAIYYPLVLTSFWVQHALWGLNPTPYHVVNVLMHAACAVVLWRVLLALRVRAAWFGALLWALHPVQVESVAWITELKNTQSGLFYLLASLFFLKWRERDGAKSVHYAFALLFAVLAILSKSSTVMLPVVLWLCWWWLDGCWPWRKAGWLAPFFLVSAVASAWTIWEEKAVSGAVGSEWAFTLPERFIIAGKAVWFYLFKLLWPEPLILIYPRWEIDGSQFAGYLPLAAAVACSLALWLVRAKWARPAFFAWSCFVVLLFPVLGFFDVAYFAHSFVADHFQYLASMAPLALAGSGLATALNASWQKPACRAAVCGISGIVLALMTWRHSAFYVDAQSLYERTLQKNPSTWVVRNNLANLLSQKGSFEGAIREYRAALKLREHYAEAHSNIGNALLHAGQVDEAILHVRRALEIKPVFADAENNLGNALLQKGEIEESILHFRSGLRINPKYASAHSGLGVALAQTGRMEEARQHFELAVENDPDSSDPRFNLANLCLQTGRGAEAVGHLQKALEIQPDFPMAQNTLAWTLATWPDAAIRNGPKSLEIVRQLVMATAGRSPAALDTLAAAYAECGRFAEAVETARRALDLAVRENDAALADEIRRRMRLYQSGLPYHEATRN